MKKIILKFTGLAALAALMMFNVQFFSAGSDADSGVSLSYVENIAFASGESGGGSGTTDCPGGSCEKVEYFDGKPKTSCKSCCPEGKNPKCGPFGCTCEG